MMLYNSIGDIVTRYELNVEEATLTRRESLQMPSTVQYAWPHPSGRYLYVATTDSARGSPGITGTAHRLCALQVSADGTLSFHGEPQALRQRPLHVSVDRVGGYALVCYNAPAHLSIHRIGPDGALQGLIEQPPDLDLGIFPHQILALPSNRAVSLVTRGNPARASRPAQPGAIKLFHFADGRLSPLDNIAVGGNDAGGYGPRHVDYHPSNPWVYVLVELQNELHMHRMAGDRFDAQPTFVKSLTRDAPQPGVLQVGGAIHVHPSGRFVYASNRVSATTSPDAPFPFVAGENNIAVFAIDPQTGEPEPIQFVDPEGFHVRTFAIDPSGRLLIAASLMPMELQDGDRTRIVPAGLSLFRIQPDGRLSFVRKYEVDQARGVQQMWVTTLQPPPRLRQ
jgi:6-phosphogluconolactonase (cycloisomerase 2 family)